LDAVMSGLVSGSSADLLATEQHLAAAVARLARIPRVDADDRVAVAAQLRRARAALERCRAVGHALSRTIDGCLGVHGFPRIYDRSGTATLQGPPTSGSAGMGARVSCRT
ncbi:MAG: hypothetical protein ACHQO8_12755, partial [Vicinamibacterales bacterium]